MNRYCTTTFRLNRHTLLRQSVLSKFDTALRCTKYGELPFFWLLQMYEGMGNCSAGYCRCTKVWVSVRVAVLGTADVPRYG